MNFLTFSDFPDLADTLLMTSGGGNIPLRDLETTKCIAMKFLPDIGTYKEAQNQKKIE